jgi:hypothetical protein
MCLSVFQNSAKNIKVLLNSEKNNGTLRECLCTFMKIFDSVLLRMRNLSDGRFRDNQNTFYVNKFFLQKSCLLKLNVGY